MSSSRLIRWSGILTIVAGASLILSTFSHPSSPQSAAWVPVHLLFFAGLVATLLALIGIMAYQLQRAGRLGLVGFFTAFVGTAMMLMEGREHLFSPDFGVGTPRGLPELIVASSIFGIGFVLLGIAIVRAGVLPGDADVLLAVGGPIYAFSPPIGVRTVEIVSSVLLGIGLVWVGYVLSSGREAVVVAEDSPQPSHAK
jgi:hypothetical protein